MKIGTGKSLSETLIFASTNPQLVAMFCACSFHGNSMNNLLSYYGLIDAKIRASDKDLPVQRHTDLDGPLVSKKLPHHQNGLQFNKKCLEFIVRYSPIFPSPYKFVK